MVYWYQEATRKDVINVGAGIEALRQVVSTNHGEYCMGCDEDCVESEVDEILELLRADNDV